jgi:hypothetical protein
MAGYFAKPVRTAWKLLHQQRELPAGDHTTLLFSQKSTRLNHIMQLYEQVRVAGGREGVDVKKVVLFPEGVVSVPGDDVPESDALRVMLIRECVRAGFTGLDLRYRPLIIFSRLSPADGWRNDKPPTTLQQHYLIQLQNANNSLNLAHVAHLDQRPANIMWRRAVTTEDMSRVELYLIDFEDSELFDHEIPSEFVAAVVRSGDMRYPFRSGDENAVQLARKFHNDFFIEAVSQWVMSAIANFEEFMNQNGAEILSSLLM